MFVDIVPLTRIPLSRPQVYTYRADGFEAALTVGQAVTVPLYNRRVAGIIAQLHEQPPQPGIIYKTITAITDPQPLLSADELAAYQAAAAYYLVSVGLLLKHALPALPKRRLKKLSDGLATIPSVTTSPAPRPAALPVPIAAIGSVAHRREQYRTAIAAALQAGRQALFLTPGSTLLPQQIAWLQAAFPDRVVLPLPAGLSKTDELLAWRRAQAGAADIVVGTRRAVFTSFRALGCIVVDDADDISYKQWEMNPRYHAQKVAELRAQHEHCVLIIGSAAATVPTWVRIQQQKYESAALPLEPQWRLVDMRAELRAKNYSVISYDLEQALAQTLAAGKQALVFVARHGSSTFVLCRDCGYVSRCPRCEVALVEYNDLRLRCPRCAFVAPAPTACPTCRSPRIKGFGAGIEKAEHELARLFPAARLARWDTAGTGTLADIQQRYQAVVDGGADIILTTPLGLRLDLPRLGVCAAVDTDSLLNIPQWHASEQAWSTLHALGASGRPAYLQTYNPEHPLLQRLSDPSRFYRTELRQRRDFRYPPFVQLILLTCRHDDKRILTGEVSRVARQLHEALPAGDVIGPLEPLAGKKREFWYRQIMLKLAFSERSAKLGNILENLSNSWSIDVDPVT